MVELRDNNEFPDEFNTDDLSSMKDGILDDLENMTGEEEKKKMRELIAEIEKIDSLHPQELVNKEMERLDAERAASLAASLESIKLTVKEITNMESSTIASEKIQQLNTLVDGYDKNIEEVKVFESFKKMSHSEQVAYIRKMPASMKREQYVKLVSGQRKEAYANEVLNTSQEMKKDRPILSRLVDAVA